MPSIISIGLLFTVLAFVSARSAQTGHGYGIMGGELANITELPHQVFIKEKGGDIICGGSIITARHILSSRYLSSNEPSDLIVVAATSDRLTGGEEYTVAKITRHPNEGIIIVLELAKEIVFSPKARPITLARPKYRIRDGAKMIASGWGIYADKNESDVLRKVTIGKVSDVECKNTIEGYGRKFNVTVNFCAGGNGKRPCGYDQGGPVITKTRKGGVLVGVVGWYNSCDIGNKPAVLFKVPYLYKWIKEIVKDDLQSYELSPDTHPLRS